VQRKPRPSRFCRGKAIGRASRGDRAAAPGTTVIHVTEPRIAPLITAARDVVTPGRENSELVVAPVSEAVLLGVSFIVEARLVRALPRRFSRVRVRIRMVTVGAKKSKEPARLVPSRATHGCARMGAAARSLRAHRLLIRK